MCSSFDLGRLFVVGVLTLISVIAYSSQIMVFWSFLGGYTLRTLLVLTPLNVFVVLIYVNYYLALSTDPGAVPANWEPPVKGRLMEVKRSTHQPRFCKTCNVFKPPRSHHCRQCGRCVLKMDHHCPWINNCVGFRNYGHFLRFILTVDIATLYVLALLCWRAGVIMDDIKNFRYDAEPEMIERVFLVLNFALDIPVLFCVGALSAYHIYCVSTNTTTIEGWEKGKVATMVRRGKIQDIKFPYDVGVYRNVKQVLGDNPLLWLWPQFSKGDGLSFAVAKDTDPLDAYFWPPRDPEDNRPSIFSSRYHKQARKRRTTKNPNASLQPQPYYSNNQDSTLLDQNVSSPHYNQNPGDNTQSIANFNNQSNSSDTHVNQFTQPPPAQYPYVPPRPRRHIRRDSEGYIVRELTLEERQRSLHNFNSGPYDLRAGQQRPLLNFEEEERGRRGAPMSVAVVNGGDEDAEDEFDDYYDSASAYSDSPPEFTESEEEEDEGEGHHRADYDGEPQYYYDGERREYGEEAGIPLREVEGGRWEEEYVPNEGEGGDDDDDDDERTPLAVIAKRQREAMGWVGVGKGKED